MSKPNLPDRELLPEQWSYLTGILIIERDGWEHSTSNFEPRDWDTPISAAEFEERAMHSKAQFPEGYFEPDVTIDDCQHTNVAVDAEVRKVVQIDDQSKVVSLQLVIEATCARCGVAFHFPHFMPGIGEQHAAVLNAHATILSLPISPGPATPVVLSGPPIIPTMEGVPAHN